MIKLLIPALLATSCLRVAKDKSEDAPELLVPSVTIEETQTKKASTDQIVIGNAGDGETLKTDDTPSVTIVEPVLPAELENDTVPDSEHDPVGAPARAVVKTLICTGRGEPGLTFSSKIEFYDDGVRRFHFSLWNREEIIENFEAFEEAGAYSELLPLDLALVGMPVSSKVQHGFMQGYREFLGYSEDARLYQQLFMADDRGGLELRVGQTGDENSAEFFGLDAARCVEI